MRNKNRKNVTSNTMTKTTCRVTYEGNSIVDEKRNYMNIRVLLM